MLKHGDRRFPVLTPEMVKPIDVPIPTDVAKALFKQFTVEIGYLDRREVADHVRYFAEEMREREATLRLEVSEAKQERAYQRPAFLNGLSDLRRELKGASDPQERSDIEEDIQEYLQEIAELDEALANAKAALQAFRTDKRTFFVEYLNLQLHGTTHPA